MRIIIIGAGNAGRQLAAKLCHEKHDVVMIDQCAAPLREIEAQQDILTIQGQGSTPKTLEEAEVGRANLVVAVTNSDEVNILAGMFANAAGVPHSIVRVTNADYISAEAHYSLKDRGIDLLVSQKAECARELFNILCRPGTQDVVDLLNNSVQAVSIKVHSDSPLLTAPLKSFPEPDLIRTIRFIATMRGNAMTIPSGDTQFLIGDDVYVVGKRGNITAFLDYADPDHLSFQRIVIAGGGDVGLNLAIMLESVGIKASLIEQSEERAQECAKQLDRTLVIHGDALQQEALEETGLNNQSGFVAVTGDDENNIICCLLAEKIGATFTAAQIAKTEYVPIINSSSLLDRAVNPHTAMINAILQYIRGQNVQAATMLHNLPGELLEVDLPARSPWVGKQIKDLALPEGDIIAAVSRDGNAEVATGETGLETGDRLLIFSKPGAFKKLESVLHS